MSLKDLTVMVTRPKPQGEELCKQISAQGGKAIFFPTIEILPLVNAKFRRDMTELDQYDIVVFVSRHAVFHSITIINSLWPAFPPHLQVMAIGESTADALTK